MTFPNKKPPVAIGGVGGSGTRLIAGVLHELGFHMGFDISEANDNLAFTLLFKRRELWPLDTHASDIEYAWKVFLKIMHNDEPLSLNDKAFIQALSTNDRPQHPAQWLKQRASNILGAETATNTNPLWGWKEPNTHIVMPSLAKLAPGMKYIHVMRHGMDMAHSANQNQPATWGEFLLHEKNLEPTPENSLRYWCESHRRIIAEGEKLGPNFLLLNYDNFCLDSSNEVPKLLEFLGQNSQENIQKIMPLISPPAASIGRYKKHAAIPTSIQDLEFLDTMGYGI